MEQTGIGSDELPALIECLQQCGFVFRRTEKTIGIVKEPESLVPEMILAGLQTNTIGRDVLVFRETSSTNDRARQAGLAGAGEGLVIFAESQTGGRGTRGRKWVSTAGVGLWFSILLRTRMPASQWPLLVQMAAVACCRSRRKMGRANGADQAAQRSDAGRRQAGWVPAGNIRIPGIFKFWGSGSMCDQHRCIEGYPTAALEQFTRGRVSRAALAAELLNHFEDWYLKRPLAEISSAFERRI